MSSAEGKAKGSSTPTGEEHAAPEFSPENNQDPEKSAKNPVRRLAGESRALFDDLREWVDLKVQLVQVDIEERIEKAANEIIALVMVVVLGLFAAAFLLHGLAIWLGSVLGGAQWGYLIVAGVLGFTTLILKSAKVDFMSRRKEESPPKADSLPRSSGPKATLPQMASKASETVEKREGEDHG